MLLDIAIISKVNKPLTDQGLEGIQTQLSQEQSTRSINNTKANRARYAVQKKLHFVVIYCCYFNNYFT